MKTKPSSIGLLIGRILVSLIFVFSGANKIISWEKTADQMANQGMVWIPFFLVGAICLELGGGLSVLLGLWTRIGTILLMIFLVSATYVFHDFWAHADPERQKQMIQFMKNLAIFGGLLVIAAAGPGSISFDGRRRVKNEHSRPEAAG